MAARLTFEQAIVGEHKDNYLSKLVRTGDDSCWDWQAYKDGNGYGHFAVWDPIQKVTFGYLVHRISYWLHTGEDPGDLFVCHKCDNPSCSNPKHLFLGTMEDNRQDMIAKRRSAFGDRNGSRTRPERKALGERNGHAKLTCDKVVEIRHAYQQGRLSQRKLAKLYNVSKGVIDDVVNHRTWKHVE